MEIAKSTHYLLDFIFPCTVELSTREISPCSQKIHELNPNFTAFALKRWSKRQPYKRK